jgi:mono/diheme cytochrome c family protein
MDFPFCSSANTANMVIAAIAAGSVVQAGPVGQAGEVPPTAAPPVGLARQVLLALLALFALLAFSLIAVAALGLQPAYAAPPPGGAGTSDPAVLYHNYCSVCHGDKGDGKSRATGALSTLPRDFTSADSRRELTPERIAAAIAQGRPGTAMVGWKTQLSETDIQRLAEFVHQRYVLGQGGPASTAGISGTKAHGGREADAQRSGSGSGSGKPVDTPARVDMTAGLPNGLKGDAKRGGAFYLANCATCHGARGDGAGPRAYFINPKPRNFTEDGVRERFNRVALYAAVSEGRLGSEMPAWSKVSSPQQIADVAEYVFQSFVQGRPAAKAAAAPR